MELVAIYSKQIRATDFSGNCKEYTILYIYCFTLRHCLMESGRASMQSACKTYKHSIWQNGSQTVYERVDDVFRCECTLLLLAKVECIDLVLCAHIHCRKSEFTQHDTQGQEEALHKVEVDYHVHFTLLDVFVSNNY